MKAYVTTIGEKTTDLCCWQLERLGFEVIKLDVIESWWEKYQRFINTANEDCIRIDADVIPNQELADFAKRVEQGILSKHWLMAQFNTYDFYKNKVGITSPVFYRQEALAIIRRNLIKLDPGRPEASAWRLDEINPNRNLTSPLVVGFHGFFQDKPAIERAKVNKISRRQNSDYDWTFVERVNDL